MVSPMPQCSSISGNELTSLTAVARTVQCYIASYQTAEEAHLARDLVMVRLYGAAAKTRYPISLYHTELEKRDQVWNPLLDIVMFCELPLPSCVNV
jgi:hypothetical protein